LAQRHQVGEGPVRPGHPAGKLPEPHQPRVDEVASSIAGDEQPALQRLLAGVAGRAPCMVHFDGFDVMKELIYMRGMASALTERGISVLIVDHPGVGEALRLRGMKLFAEVERPAKACVVSGVQPDQPPPSSLHA